jgi:signal transduction histidine kinase
MTDRNKSPSNRESYLAVPHSSGDGADLLAMAARVLLTNTRDAVFVLDVQDRVVALNPAARQLVGHRDREVIGRPIAELFVSWPEKGNWLQSNPVGADEEISISHQQSQFLLRIWPIQHTPAYLDGRLAVLREVTDVEQMATERDRAHRMAQAAHKDLFVTDRRLAEMEQMKSDFIANVSHQLRTPVANLQIYLYLLQQNLGDQQKRHFDVLQRQVNELQQLVAGILDFSRWEAHETTEEFVPVDLNQLLEQVLPAYRAEAEARGLAFALEVETTSLLVRGRPGQLAGAIGHLLENALAYTQHGKITVRLAVWEERRQASLVVQDTGSGIHPDDLPYLFRRFYRGLGVRETDKPGAGLGLNLVKQIISMHGGNVQVESQVGEGSLFRIQLPLMGKA